VHVRVKRTIAGVALRIVHTSDWHLGRALHEESLLEDQAWALDRLEALLRDARPDALVVAGDVYDRAVPPAEAVSLLDEFLTRVAELGTRVIAIAGNHDSPERLSFASRLLEARGVHLRGGLDRCADPIEIQGRGFVYAVPFVDPDLARGATGDEELRGHAAATDRVLAGVRSDAARRALPTVLVAHAFVQGAQQTPDSERPCAVGSAGNVPVSALAGFDYVALGHLHAPQQVAAAMRYSGSLLKYSFSEATQVKGAAVVEVERGVARAEVVSLGARRDVVRVQGTLDELLRRPDLAKHQGDLVEAVLDDDGYVVDAKNRLQARFRHVLNVTRKVLAPGGEGKFARRVEDAGSDDLKLFESFFETVAGVVPGPEHRAVFADVLAELRRTERAA
jgi:exonuclease SbcD